MFIEVTAKGSQCHSIAQLGIMTAERPLLLKRALDSYITRLRDYREIEYVVFDDSKSVASRCDSLEVAREARRKFDVQVRFAGREERAAYARRLHELTGQELTVLTGALVLDSGYTLGQNRNALLLDAAGVSCFCADDDTLCTPLSPLVIETTKIRTVTEEDPSEYWCFGHWNDLVAFTEPFDGDVLGAHEELLGKTVGEMEDRMVSQVPSPVGKRYRKPKDPSDRVRVTFNGLAGDCGWGAPFGLWHEPMGYLGFGGSSLRRLIASDELYQQAILSRRLLRVATSAVLGDFSFSMLTFCGLDNCEMLPPNPSKQRGQDLVFGQILSKCFPGALSGHVPVTLGHEPVPPRRFWPGEITRSAAGVDLCRLIIEAVGSCEFQPGECTAGQRLQALGEHLLHIGRLPDRALSEFFARRLYESNRSFAQKITARMESMSVGESGYAADVNRYLQKLRASETRDDYWIPLDLWSVEGAASAVRRLREILTGFGQLLGVWPATYGTARMLRRDGLRLSVPV